jgi:hypothetical protein
MCREINKAEAPPALLTRFKRKDKVKTWGLLIARRAAATRDGGRPQAGGDHADVHIRYRVCSRSW